MGMWGQDRFFKEENCSNIFLCRRKWYRRKRKIGDRKRKKIKIAKPVIRQKPWTPENK